MKAILFDMDGVLVGPSRLHYLAMKIAINEVADIES